MMLSDMRHLGRVDLINEIDAILGRDDFLFSERLLERLVASGLAAHDASFGWHLLCDDAVVVAEALAIGGRLNTAFTVPDIPASWMSETGQ